MGCCGGDKKNKNTSQRSKMAYMIVWVLIVAAAFLLNYFFN